MANEKVSQLPSLSNLQDADLIEITKYMGVGLGDDGGDYKSYQMTWEAFKTFIKCDEIVKITLSSAGSESYDAARYENVFRYVMTAADEVTIKMGVLANDELYLPLTEATAGIINQQFNSSNYAARQIVITTSAAATIYLFVTKNLIP